MSDTLFATLIEKTENAKGKTHIHVPDDWMQGRTVYGGLVAALALRSMRVHAPRKRKVRTLFISFIGALDALIGGVIGITAGAGLYAALIRG